MPLHAPIKILVTGIHGQVGHALMQLTWSDNVLIEGVDRNAFDLSNTPQILDVLNAKKPNIIINPAAYTAVDKAESEPELAYQINAEAPSTIATWAKENDALLIHYSTDYVFDGLKSAPYHEQDETNPQSVYGASKLKGEQLIAQSGANHIILRTSWVYGRHGNNFIKTILRLAQSREQLNIVADQIGAPTGADFIASTTQHIVYTYLQAPDTQSLNSIYHMAPQGTTSWYEYAKLIVSLAESAGKKLLCKSNSIHPIPTEAYPTPAKRPLNSRLDCSKLAKAFNLTIPDWRTGVEETTQFILMHEGK